MKIYTQSDLKNKNKNHVSGENKRETRTSLDRNVNEVCSFLAPSRLELDVHFSQRPKIDLLVRKAFFCASVYQAKIRYLFVMKAKQSKVS